jgi:hypothetical protein
MSAHLQGQRISQETNQDEAGSKQNFNSEDGDDMFLQNVSLLSMDYMAKIEPFITTLVRTSNPTNYLKVGYWV